MKKYRIYTLLACVCMIMQSCLFNEEDIFDDSSAQRAIASVSECQEILKGAENGWLMEYYTGSDASYGGFNLLAKFDDSNVTMMSEMATNSYAVGDESVSQYKVVSFQGTQLSFDGYNEMIHTFCEPNGFGDLGYAGDYEFIFRTVTKEKIVLTGKKHGNTLVMTPLAVAQNRKEYITQVAKVAESASYATYKLYVGGKEIGKMGQELHAFNMEKGEDVFTYPFIYTQEGVKMLEPMVIDGKSMTSFKWDDAKQVYICADQGVDAKIEFYCPEAYLKYLGNYLLTSTDGKKQNVSLIQKQKGKTYVMSIKLPKGTFEFVFTYNVATELIQVLTQKVGLFNGFDVSIYPGDAGNSFYTQPGLGFVGIIASEPGKPLRIEFEKNFANEGVDRLLLVYENDGYRLVDMLVEPVLTKID